MSNWTPAQINAVWTKVSQTSIGKDQCGAWLKRSAYGDRSDAEGWEIDHITPKANGGTDALSNLRPLHWRNNVGKSNGRLVTVVKAEGNQNVIKNQWGQWVPFKP